MKTNESNNFNGSLQPEQTKMIFNHLIENPELIENTETNIFNEHKLFDNVFKVIKTYYKKYNSIPKTDIIKVELENQNITESITTINMAFNNGSEKEKNSNREDYINELYKNINRFYFAKNETLKSYDDFIEAQHNTNKLKELASKFGYNSEIEENEIEIDELTNSEYLDNSIYENLPDILNRMCNVFNKPRKKDVFLLSELVVLSVLFENVKGIFHNEPTYSNLYAFIAAPAASGKGIMSHSKDTLYKINRKLKDIYTQDKAKYTDEELKLNNKREKRILLQGNASSASFIYELDNNDGSGLIFENEADTITNNKKQDWGDYSDGLRKGFEHETISSARKTEGIIEIEKPKLSVLISGTIEQLLTYIPSSENGLFSRFMYYTFKQETFYENPFINKENYKELFTEKYGSELLNIYDYYKSNKNEIEFSLTDEQSDKFYKYYNNWLEETKAFYLEKDIEASVLRLGKITFRICMILSILRNYQKSDKLFSSENETNIFCENIDFENAIKITKTLLNHSKLVYNNMPQRENKNFVRNNNDRLFNDLPIEFTKNIALKYAERYDKLSEITIKRLFAKWLNGNLIEKKDRYTYKKIL